MGLLYPTMNKCRWDHQQRRSVLGFVSQNNVEITNQKKLFCLSEASIVAEYTAVDEEIMKLSRGSFEFFHIKVIWLLALGKQSVHINATVELEDAARGTTYLVVVKVRSGCPGSP